MQQMKHSHYHKPCPYESVDVYRLLKMFDVTDQAVGHAIKKLLVAGGRGAGKSFEQDIKEAIDTLTRLLDMCDEDRAIHLASLSESEITPYVFKGNASIKVVTTQ